MDPLLSMVIVGETNSSEGIVIWQLIVMPELYGP